MASTVEQVKARLSIVEVVSGYLKLERAGANYRACCPFHQERTPSFFVSPGRGSYHCFGCNRGGDLISFVQEIENLDFIGALKLLAERAGVPFRLPDPELVSLKDRLYRLMRAAADYYAKALEAYQPALEYLRERGLSAETIKEHRLGWAPLEWRVIGGVLARQGFSEAEVIKAGLLVPVANPGPGAGGTGKKPYDRFRGRLMFPLTDGAGRVVAFSGRLLVSGDERAAKYINSPDTPLYDKSTLLYLYDRARLPMRQADRCILVEGQVDALLSHQHGLTETVAVSGTALTRDHLLAIKRLTNNLVMAFDADPAGLAAGRRAVELALSEGLEVKIASLPPDRDPADLLLVSPEKWRTIVDQALQVIDFLLKQLEEHKFKDRRELAHAVQREVYPFIRRLANPIDQAYFINQIATRLSLPEAVIRSGVEQASPAGGESKGGVGSPAEPESQVPPSRRSRLEELIIGFVVWREEPAWVKLIEESWGKDYLQKQKKVLAPRWSELALAVELAYNESSNLERDLAELLSYWQEETWREEMAELLVKIRGSSGAPPDKLAPLLARYQELSTKINDLKKYE